MKRLGVYLALIFPAVLLGLWSAFPEADPRLAAPITHFYLVSFTTFAATVVSLFVIISVGETAQPRHLFLAAAFAWMGAVFLIHGATTPGALITHFHPAVTWSSWLTLFGGGVIFLISGFASSRPRPALLRVVALAISVAYVAYLVVVFAAPDLLTTLLALNSAPRVVDLVFVLTLVIWMVGAVRHYLNWRQTHHFIDGLMAFEAGWYATATVSMFRFELWRVGWWMYHVLLLLGFLIAIYALWRAYEQVRTFRLTAYFAATSLIVTAALALLAAQLYSNLAFDNLRQELEADTENLSRHMGDLIAADLPEVTTSADLSALDPQAGLAQSVWSMRLSLVSLQEVALYDNTGREIYSTMSAPGEHQPPPQPDRYQAALSGTTSALLLDPGSAVGSYQPTEADHLLLVYTPFYPAGGPDTSGPIGVLLTLRAASQLTTAQIYSRAIGLGLATVTMGALFLALLFIVFRADYLIRARARELETAYAELRQAEGLRDDLTHMIVHDLRNPLSALTANLDLIGRTLNNPAYPDAPPRFLSGARAAGQRMTGMIDDLLNVGKFEAGELRPTLVPVYLPTVLTDKVESYRSQAEKDGKTLTVRAPAELPTVMADLALIGRVIDNLLSNALKYTDPGGKIQIEAERRDSHLVVRVSDNGAGIPAAHQARIFEKFVQVTDEGGQPLRKGTGLGLAFCRLAVEAHGGKIRVESTPGYGSIFFFTLPLSPPPTT
ncbi:MAG: HAMP domain-containing histidine kinase [Anaerolineales bacterium]|nr:HAMP domain-containing histidine kinase [Anaerolineales bacterium]